MRKASVSAQLSRTARRFSTVIAPQLTKLDMIGILQKHQKLVIQIADVVQLQEAIKQFVLHNNSHFDPVEFYIRTPEISPKSNSAGDPSVVLVSQFYAEEIVLFEGTRRLLSICLNDGVQDTSSTPPTMNPFAHGNSMEASSGNFGNILAKVRHPISGMKIFEVTESPPMDSCGPSWIIIGTMDELNKCRIETESNIWRQLLSVCGFTFSKGWWSVEHCGVRVAQVYPRGALFAENSICVEWSEEANNELRLLTLCFGIIQTIREAYPSLLHIIQGNIKRKAALS